MNILIYFKSEMRLYWPKFFINWDERVPLQLKRFLFFSHSLSPSFFISHFWLTNITLSMKWVKNPEADHSNTQKNNQAIIEWLLEERKKRQKGNWQSGIKSLKGCKVKYFIMFLHRLMWVCVSVDGCDRSMQFE